jgi:hypothetical protein
MREHAKISTQVGLGEYFALIIQPLIAYYMTINVICYTKHDEYWIVRES